MPKRDLVRRIDIRNDGLFGSGNLTASRTPPKYWGTVVVAAYNSSPEGRAGADYVCDGIDDHVQINAAFTSGGNSPKRVVLLEGTFKISARIVMVTNSTLEGQGDSTLLLGVTTGLEFIQLASNCQVKNLKIDGELRTSTNGMEGDTINDVIVENCTVSNFATNGIIWRDSNRLQVSDCRFTDTDSSMNGVLGDGSTYIQIVNCYFDGCGEGVILDPCDACAVVGNNFLNCYYGIDAGGDHNAITGNHMASDGAGLGSGINIFSGSGRSVGRGVTVSGNTTYSYDLGISISDMEHSSVNGNTLTGLPSSSTSTYGIDGTDCDHCNFSGNVCSNNNNAGIYINGGEYNLIVGNTCVGNSNSTNTNPVSNNSAGIVLQITDYNFVTANKVRKSSTGSSYFQAYGIFIQTSGGNNVIVGNDLRDGGYHANYHIGFSSSTNYYIDFDGTTPQRTLTLASDVVTVVGSGYYTILPQSGTADDLVTINGYSDGMIIHLRAEASGDTITAKETGNLALSSDFVMNSREDVLTLLYDADQAKWLEAGRVSGSLAATVTIASGAIAVQKTYHLLLPESSTTDDLDTISGGRDGMVIYVRNSSATNTITLKNGTGNLDITADVVLNAINVVQPLIYDGATSKWFKA